MNRFEYLSSVSKLYQGALNKTNIKAFHNYSDIFKSVIPELPLSNTASVFKAITDKNKALFPELPISNSMKAFKNLNERLNAFSIEPSMSSAIEAFKNPNDMLNAIYHVPLIKDGFNKYKNLFTSINDQIYESIKGSGFSSINNLTASLKNIIPEPLINNRFDMYKNLITSLDYLSSEPSANNDVVIIENSDHSLNTELLRTINSAITQTVEIISSNTDFDDSDKEIANNLGNCALEMALSNKLPFNIKKNILLNIAQNLWKLLGIPQFQSLFAIFTFIIMLIVSLLAVPVVHQNILIKQTINQITIINNENKTLNLRGITYNSVKIYLAPKTKSTVVFTLDCGDIVEVLMKNKKWIYIRVYKTGIEGWILKKYTKGNNKNNRL